MAGTWTTARFKMPAVATSAAAFGKKPHEPTEATIALPVGCERIRGVGLSMGLAGSVLGNPWVRAALHRQGFALIDFKGLGIFADESDRTDLIGCLEGLAAVTKHPELSQVPWLPVGCSTTTLTARNIAAWKPERTVAVISFAGGNLHQYQGFDLAARLPGVPFLSVTGERDVFGPEGGLRPEYGRQTQWVMLREQMLRWRAANPAMLASLIVIEGADHARWSQDISPLTAMFVEKAIQGRVPTDDSIPATPVVCRTIDPTTGWLSSADIYDPRDPPQPASEAAEKAARSFWHSDADLARAILEYHRGRFVLPDPTRNHPVPANWPPTKPR